MSRKASHYRGFGWKSAGKTSVRRTQSLTVTLTSQGHLVMEDDRMISLNDFTAQDGLGFANLDAARKKPQPEAFVAASIEAGGRVKLKLRHPIRRLAIGITIVIGLMALSVPVDAQSWQPPADNQRCPSKWGASDERGRPGRDPVRRLRPSDHRRQGLQLLQGRRDRQPERLHQTGNREGRRPHHAWRAHRCGRAERGGHPA